MIFTDPLLALLLLILNVFSELLIFADSQHLEILATSAIGLITSCFLYISIISTYSFYRNMFLDRRILQIVLCCVIAKKLKTRNQRYKYRYIVLLASISIAIALTVLSSNVMTRLKESPDFQDDPSNHVEYRYILLHCIFFWMLGMYQASIGCFKLAILLTFVLIFWPCILCYMYKYGEND